MGQPLFIFMGIAVAAIAVWCALGIARIVRGRCAGGGRPVCAHCTYALGGWPTPVCPECGQDVRRVGVRAGGSPAAIVLAGVVASAVVVLGAPFVAMLVMAAMPTSRSISDMHLTWQHSNGTLQTDYWRQAYDESWRRRAWSTGEVEISRRGRTAPVVKGSAPSPVVPLALQGDGGPPPRDQLERAMRFVDPTISDEELDLLATGLIDMVNQHVSSTALMPTGATSAAASGFAVSAGRPDTSGPTAECVSWQSGRRTSSWNRWYHWVATFGATSAIALLVLRAAHRSRARGWRAVSEGEWSKLPEPDGARG